MEQNQEQNIEPILYPSDKRLVLFPIKYPIFQDLYKKHVSTFWTPEEVDISKDINHLKKLTADELHFILHVLAFFSSADGIVNENLAINFYSEIQVPEARCFYGFQIMIENIHNEMYSLMIDTFSPSNEKEKLFNAINTFPSIRKLADWAYKWIRSDESFSKRVIAFACIEGILFSGPFCAIFWLKKRGLMPGLCHANELISRDERLHTEMATVVHKHLVNPASYQEVLEIVKEIVELEKEFIIESLPCDLIGMNSREMSQYIEYVADGLLTMFGFSKHYKVTNPFQWMDLISAPNKTSFFERRVSEYSKDIKTDNNINVGMNTGNNELKFDDF